MLKIVKGKPDAAALCAMDAMDLMEFLANCWRDRFHRTVAEMNDVQLRFFLCMELENTCQADDILNLTDDEEVFFRLPQMHQSLLELGAPQTAEALQEFMDLLPEGTIENRAMPRWEWFFEDEERNARIHAIWEKIVDYPDGFMQDLYHQAVRSDPDIAWKLLER